MKHLTIGLGLVFLGIVIVLLLGDRHRHAADERPAPTPAPPSPPSPVQDPSRPASPPKLLSVAATAERFLHPEGSPNEDALILDGILGSYRRHFGGNPVGDNDDITAALRGRNAKNLAYFPAEHPALDRNGQLIDRWGTPWFFHPLSAKHMEIRSAGPDRELWSNDDLVHAP